MDPQNIEQLMPTLMGGVILGSILIGLAIGLAISIVICLILVGCFKRIPPEHRQMEPGMVWLLMIPCFNLIWNFFVFPKLSQSFKGYFDAVDDTTVGDCGASLGMAYAIVSACCVIPYAGCLTAVASIVLLIVCLVKATGLKNRIPQV